MEKASVLGCSALGAGIAMIAGLGPGIGQGFAAGVIQKQLLLAAAISVKSDGDSSGILEGPERQRGIVIHTDRAVVLQRGHGDGRVRIHRDRTVVEQTHSGGVDR